MAFSPFLALCVGSQQRVQPVPGRTDGLLLASWPLAQRLTHQVGQRGCRLSAFPSLRSPPGRPLGDRAVRCARHGCGWLHHTWDARVPNDLLSVAVSRARPPHPACASGTWKAPWWAAPSPYRFAERTPPPPERSPPASPYRACSVSASRDEPGLEASLRRGVLPFPRTAPAPSAAGGRAPPSRSAVPGSAPGPSAPDTPVPGHGRAASAASPRPSRWLRRGWSAVPPWRCLTRQRWCRARVGSASGPPVRRLPCHCARPATRNTPSQLTPRSFPHSLSA
jgi:hypothetical protein